MAAKKGSVLRTCKYCSNEFYTFPYKIKEGKGLYCSKKCYSLDKSKQVECRSCGKKFRVPNSRLNMGRGVFCSKACENSYTPKQRLVKCDYCGVEFKAKESELKRNKHKYCSTKCYNKDYRKHYSGEKSANWSGGVHRDKHNSSYRYSDWRLKVYERDSFTCQECGQVGGKLNAHHLFEWSKFKSFRFELWNGITLCEKCHRKIHFKK